MNAPIFIVNTLNLITICIVIFQMQDVSTKKYIFETVFKLYFYIFFLLTMS